MAVSGDSAEYRWFRDAVAALDAGDLPLLKTLLDAHPEVLRYECRVGRWYEVGYFSGATLLWHIAGNPDRCPLPANILAIARLLVERHVTQAEAQSTIGLLLTSRQASAAGIALPLIDLLRSVGAELDLHAPDTLTAPLLNGAPETARALVHRGATVELRHAAALGELEVMMRLLAKSVDQEALDHALIFACIGGQHGASALLIGHGAKGDALLAPGGQTPRTALHEAANRGHVELVQMLLEAGAMPTVAEPRWRGTAADWAEQGGFPEIATKLRDRERGGDG